MKFLTNSVIVFGLVCSLGMFANNAVAGDSYVPTYQLKDYNPFDDVEEVDVTKKGSDKKTSEKQSAAKKKKEAEIKKVDTKKSSLVAKENAYIPAGLKFNVELVQNVSSKGFKKDSLIKVRVCDNIIINDVVVVEKGSAGTAYIYQARKAAGLGRKGKLKIAGNEVKTINGIPVPLRGGISGHGKTDGSAGVVFAAVSVVGGLFMKGSNITYPEGTIFEVEVREDVDLGCRKEDLKKAMDPFKPHGVSVKVK